MHSFTVVIPLYNKRNFILRAVTSVFEQTIRCTELLVVDDGSTDGGVAVLDAINDSRLRVIHQSNAGASAARNRGIDEAVGDYIAFLDADDSWAPQFLETISKLIYDFPNAGIFGTAYQIITTSGEIIYPKLKHIPPSPWRGVMPSYFRSAGIGDLPLTASSFCVNRKLLVAEHIRFPLGEALGEDQGFYAAIAVGHPVAFDWYCGAKYHQDADNRVCVRCIPEGELPFSRRLQKKLDSGNIDFHLRTDVQRYIAQHLIHSASMNIKHGHQHLARTILRDSRLKELPMHRFFWFLLSLFPARLLTYAKKAKRSFLK